MERQLRGEGYARLGVGPTSTGSQWSEVNEADHSRCVVFFSYFMLRHDRDSGGL